MLVFILILSIIPVLAVDDFNRVDGDYQRRTIVNEYGLFTANDSVVEVKDTLTIGTQNQILVSDLDTDGTSEIIIADHDTMYIYTIDSVKELYLEAKYVFTGSTSSITPAVFDDIDGDNLKEIVGVWDDFFYVLEYNSSKEFNKLSLRFKHHIERIPATNMFCDTAHEVSDDIFCYIPTQDGYIQEVHVYVPFADTTARSDFDNQYGSTIVPTNAFGDFSTGAVGQFAFMVRNHTSGNVARVQLDVASAVGVDLSDTIYADIYTCPMNKSEYDTLSCSAECSESPTFLGRINMTHVLNNTVGAKTIWFDTEYYYEPDINYSLQIRFGGSIGVDTPQYWIFNASTNPTRNLTKGCFNVTTTMYQSLPTYTLIGSASVMVDRETDITPNSDSALNGNPRSAPLLITDVDTGADKLALIHDNNDNGNEGIALIDITTLDFDDDFGLFGYIDSIRSAERIEGITKSNIDGGSEDIIISFRFNNNLFISAVDITGDRVSGDDYNVGTSCGAGSRGSMPFMLGDTAVGCAVARCNNGASSYSEIICRQLEDGTYFINHQSPTGATWDTEYIGTNSLPTYSAQMSADDDVYGSSFQIVTNRGIFYFNDSQLPAPLVFFNTIAPMTNGGTPNNIHTLTVADADDDGSLDILGSRIGGIDDNETFFATTSNQNLPPSLVGGYAYGGFGSEYGLVEPDVCLNSNIEFFAKESPIYADGNYENDIGLDEERIVTNCGYDDTGDATLDYESYIQNGSYDDDSPSIECYYNETGTYRVRLFLQDRSNDDVYVAYNSQDIIVNVVNGTFNRDCNRVSDYQDTNDITGTQTDNLNLGERCNNNSECRTNYCNKRYCDIKDTNDICTLDIECISQRCVNGRCTPSSIEDRVDALSESGGLTDNDKTLIALVISIVVMSFFIIGTTKIGASGSIAIAIGGLSFFVMLIIFLMINFISAWVVVVTYLFALILLGMLWFMLHST